jgi:hypothetical protein
VTFSGQALCPDTGGPGTFGTDANPPYGSLCLTNPAGIYLSSPNGQGGGGTREIYQIVSPDPALSFTEASVSEGTSNFVDGYDGGSYWSSGGADWADSAGTVAFPASNEFGVQLYCGDTNYCAAGSTEGGNAGAFLEATGITLQVSESQAPSLTAGGLYGQTGYVWNAAGDPWAVTLAGSDPSGVCTLQISVDGATPAGSYQTPNSGAIQQCPSPLTVSEPVDTNQLVPTSGAITLAATAVNAAQNVAAPASTSVNVDNVAPSVSIAPQSSSDPPGAGDLAITPTTGPSGISSFGCTSDGQALSLPATPDAVGAYLVTVNDSTSHTVVCSVSNNAVNPQGQHNTASASYTVKATDSTALSFKKITDALIKRTVKERVRVGYHYATRREHGKKVRVRVGGHIVTKTVVRYVEHCRVKTVKIKGKTEHKKVCTKPTVSYQNTLLVEHGETPTLYGQLSNAQGTGLAGQTVTLVRTPTAAGSTATTLATVTTGASGGWAAKLPAGPSSTITAAYGGDSTQLPNSATATLTVPAKIAVIATPHKLPWSATVQLIGHLEGGYVPADGVAMRLLIKLPGSKHPYAPIPFRTTSTGSFDVHFSWHHGNGVATYPMYVATTGNESDYPFTGASSLKIPVTFGTPTPKSKKATKPKTGKKH